MSYRVHGSPISRMTRVTWMLEELGEPYELVHARLGTRDLVGLSPSNKGPVLVDDGFVLTDSAAICLYLADKHGDAGFGPRDARERAQMESWLFFALAEFEAVMWTKIKHRVLLPKEMRLDVGPWLAAEFARELKTLHRRLGDNDYAMGDRFTCVDVILGHCGRWAMYAKFPIGSEPVAAYFERVLARPAYARAIAAEEALAARTGPES
ncbi:MAG: glutathione S-transferase family protein [Roseitalea sp.]|uniref:Glutathione S-transferase family protein n=1 Tax=Oceaniradius stylonematis TaxID=2184161 RepID=A0A3A8A9U7_9HYPH|nr:glutathione S-transferase family protein [Oceaniradius stylonematis]MBO6553688.1 glutathione S-transferase family protein [Roseitalea sp.]MBO6952731.1 glutathione S-transferase family protein [Rhizobiaceae bacterium]RNC96425.1 MAG: glutathione S-transferase family protein [Oricola sp.]MBO6592782.1 glutathione S-transferase family protein [Roseitalea sp.]MBO6600475.1 glutathione S-transferase family protein [Roseitalea sp.]